MSLLETQRYEEERRRALESLAYARVHVGVILHPDDPSKEPPEVWEALRRAEPPTSLT